MIVDPMTAACLRYLSAPLAGAAPIPLIHRLPLSGVRYANPPLVMLAAPHTMRLESGQLTTLAAHHNAEVALVTWRRDGGVCVDVAMRIVNGFRTLRGLAPLQFGNTLWLRSDDNHVWLSLGARGLRLAKRLPTADAIAVAAATEQARTTIAGFADGAGQVRELRS
ncbi:hypothetical protein JW805_13970 [Roseomonas aeriglobus]|nr:hypothetical protein [Roseomonas aeriglobus]